MKDLAESVLILCVAAVFLLAIVRVASCAAADGPQFGQRCYDHGGLPEHDWKGDRCTLKPSKVTP